MPCDLGDALRGWCKFFGRRGRVLESNGSMIMRFWWLAYLARAGAEGQARGRIDVWGCGRRIPGWKGRGWKGKGEKRKNVGRIGELGKFRGKRGSIRREWLEAQAGRDKVSFSLGHTHTNTGTSVTTMITIVIGSNDNGEDVKERSV